MINGIESHKYTMIPKPTRKRGGSGTTVFLLRKYVLVMLQMCTSRELWTSRACTIANACILQGTLLYHRMNTYKIVVSDIWWKRVKGEFRMPPKLILHISVRNDWCLKGITDISCIFLAEPNRFYLSFCFNKSSCISIQTVDYVTEAIASLRDVLCWSYKLI